MVKYEIIKKITQNKALMVIFQIILSPGRSVALFTANNLYFYIQQDALPSN